MKDKVFKNLEVDWLEQVQSLSNRLNDAHWDITNDLKWVQLSQMSGAPLIRIHVAINGQLQAKVFSTSVEHFTIDPEDQKIIFTEISSGTADRYVHSGGMFFQNFFKSTLNSIALKRSTSEWIVFLPQMPRYFQYEKYIVLLRGMFVLFLGGVFMVVFAYQLIVPIRRLDRAVQDMLDGKLKGVQQKMKRNDEIGRLNNRFLQLFEALEKTERFRNDFVRNVSHELQTPLTVLIANAKALRKGIVPEQDVQLFFEKMELEAARLSRLCDQLMFLSKLESVEILPHFTPFDLGTTIYRVVERIEHFAHSKNIQVSISCERNMMINGDEEWMEIAIHNLFHNSIRFTPANGNIYWSVMLEALPLNGKKNICLQIIDTGVGIHESQMKSIFDPFYTTDQSRKRKPSTEQSGGHGIGLTLVKRIVLLHGGSIDVSSEVGKGTKFVMNFPEYNH